MTSPWIRVESTSKTMRRLARRSRLYFSTAMSDALLGGQLGEAGLQFAIDPGRHRDPQFQPGHRVVGHPRMKSMFTPSAATCGATAPNAAALMGRPSTTMVCVDGSPMIASSLPSMVTSGRPGEWPR